MNNTPGRLIIVPTPIGNLEDITLRALRVLRESDIILAEDTRTSGILLKHFQIQKPLLSYHQHNEHQFINSLINKLLSGTSMAMISDAGTPGISDAGFLLVREAIRHEIRVECLPGPTAFVPALVISGLPCDRFHFEGFLPPKKGRKKRIEHLSNYNQTLVFYESPLRILKTVEDLIPYFGESRPASLSRELTKVFEETVRGTLGEIRNWLNAKKVKGELVLVVGGSETTRSTAGNSSK